MRLSTLKGGLVPLVALLALGAGLAGCSGGDDGKDGAAGPAGPAGTPGATGPVGPTGATGASGASGAGVDMVASTKPESCSTCHSGAGVEHESVYKDFLDSSNKNLKLDITGVTTTGAGPYTVRLDFTIKAADGTPVTEAATGLPSFAAPGQRTFYIVAYDSATKKFGKLATMSAATSPGTCVPAVNASTGAVSPCSSGAVSDGAGAYHITATGFNYDPTVAGAGYTGSYAYGYVAKSTAVLVNKGNYRLYNDFASDALPFGDAGKTAATAYVSTANVAACESCHGKPYMKHGYREAQVNTLGDLVACKSCHYDARPGSDHVWQQMLDDPYAWATGVAPDTVKYAYKANLMNDVHMSHAMEFPYPQSMSNCNTCHAGKLNQVLTDTHFTAETCKSCHAVDGKDAWEGQKYDETKRPPALKELWAAANVASFHDINLTCSDCHKSGGVARQFPAYHTGYDAMIYDAAGVKYNTLYSAAVDAVTFNPTTNVMNIKFSATNAATIPTVTVSLYGYDSKDFYISAHTRDAGTLCKSSATATTGCRLEYTAGGNTSASVTDDNGLFTEVATGIAGKWEVNLDLTKYVQPTTTASPTTTSAKIGTIPALITAGTIKKAEVAVLPSLTIGTQVVAIDAVSKTVDLANAGAFVANYFQGTNAITSVAKCNSCHDALGTTFHSPSYGGSVTVCRTCHQGTNGSAHLEMQSRSIDSFAHALHAFQYLDTSSVDFAEPVAKARYERHIEHVFPNFTILSCEGCHNSGKYNVPDQAKSMPSLLSGSYTLKNTDRAIGTVPAYVTGAGSRACAGCHRATMINEDDAGGLASLNSHVDTMGVLVNNTTPSSYLYGVIDKIMGFFK